MEVFLYKINKGKLIPDEKEGDIVVIVDGMNVKVFDKKGNEITDYSFSLLGHERALLEKIRYLEEITGIKVNIDYALAYPDIKARILKLNQLIGYLFEEYVYMILSKHFRVERNKEIFASLSKFGIESHNKPDFIVEGKIAIEAKTGDYSINQIIQYEKKYPIGAIVFPWSGTCKRTKWVCFYNFLKDYRRVIDWISIYLTK